MITATVPVQWDVLTGLNTNKGVRERLHEQLDVWLDLLEEEMERKGKERRECRAKCIISSW
jgi:hypothetical protein